jgi:signal transduction histidine kinase
LHDVVAHHVSLIGVQAGAARFELAAGGADSPQIVRALNRIEENSRRAVQEMRVLLDALRPVASVDGEASDADAASAPQPGLDDIPALAQRLRAAGIEVLLTGSGVDAPLHSGISLTVYRIIEEALTNVTKHSSARVVQVEVCVRPHDVRVRVQDPGPARGPGTSGDEGRTRRGLVGMAERVELYGGRFTTGPTATGAFTIDAWLPLVSAW